MNISEKRIRRFKRNVWNYYRRERRSFPWRRTRNPYKILVSEVMLQQTQVGRVLPKYGEFIKKFPSFRALARAPLEQVLAVWQGLGYNRRAIRLKKLSEKVVKDYRGVLPRRNDLLVALPAIGTGTAGALLAFAFHTPWPFIETNIRRVFIHSFFPKKRKVKDADILPLVKRTLDLRRPAEWYWALMDYGAMLAGQGKNPNRKSTRYRRQSPFRGSHRELRGKIITLLTHHQRLTHVQIERTLGISPSRVTKALKELRNEGFLGKGKTYFSLRRL